MATSLVVLIFMWFRAKLKYSAQEAPHPTQKWGMGANWLMKHLIPSYLKFESCSIFDLPRVPHYLIVSICTYVKDFFGGLFIKKIVLIPFFLIPFLFPTSTLPYHLASFGNLNLVFSIEI